MDWPSLSSDCPGCASTIAALLGLGIGSLGEGGFFKKKFGPPRRLLFPPLVLLGILCYLKVSFDILDLKFSYHWYLSRYWTIDQQFAGYILAAFSAVLALRAVSSLRGAIRILALAEWLIAMGFLSLEFFYTLDFFYGWS